MMNTTPTDEVVLKQDVLGRVRTPPERRVRLLEEFERSGLSGAKFAALAGIKYQTFAAWAQRRRKRRIPGSGPGVPAATDPMRWLEAVIEPAQNPGRPRPAAVVAQLPGGARLEIFDAKAAVLAAAFVRALEHPATAC